jgi:hypothetical protein
MNAGGHPLFAAALAASAGIFAPSVQAEEGKVKILAPWQGEGQIFQIEPTRIAFLARFDGILYVESAEGPLDGVPFVCPGTQLMDLASGALSAEGHCMLTPSDHEELYAKWSCTGQVGGECKGQFELTGGTGRFEGATGGGPMSVRTVLSDLIEDTRSGEVVRAAAGLAVWPELSYKLAGE